MKFALIALVASATAIKISAQAPCVSMHESNEVFDMVDTNHNGQVSRKELTTAIKAWLKEHPGNDPTKKEVRMFTNAAKEAAGADHTLSKKEFNTLANEVCAWAEKQ